MRSDRDKVEGLEKTWDELIKNAPVKSAPSFGGPNPYSASFTSTAANTDDQNLLTSFLLLSTSGFDQPVGQMMAREAEAVMPYTLHKLHLARERARDNQNQTSSRMKEEFRGMTVMAYAWAFTMSRTGKLSVKDREVLNFLYQFSESTPDTPQRRRLTASAENKMESTLGTTMQALESAKSKGQENLRLFYNGSLMMLYALANAHYGQDAAFIDDDTN